MKAARHRAVAVRLMCEATSTMEVSDCKPAREGCTSELEVGVVLPGVEERVGRIGSTFARPSKGFRAETPKQRCRVSKPPSSVKGRSVEVGKRAGR